jgi:hypothetical protein
MNFKCKMCDNNYSLDYVSYVHKYTERHGYSDDVYPRYCCSQKCLDDYNKNCRCNMCHVALGYDTYRQADNGFHYCDEIMIGNNSCYNKMHNNAMHNAMHIYIKIFDKNTKKEHDINNISKDSIIIKIIFNNISFNIFEPHKLLNEEYKKKQWNDLYDGHDINIELNNNHDNDYVAFFERNHEFINIGLSDVKTDYILMSISVLFEDFKPIIKQIIQIGNNNL